MSLVTTRYSSSHHLMVYLFMKSGGLNEKYVLINSLDFKILALNIVNRCLDSFQLIPISPGALLVNRKQPQY